MKLMTKLSEAVVERIANSPWARQAAADEERERLARRRQLTDELAELRRPDARLAELRTKEADLALKLEAARRLVAEREATLAQLRAEALGLSCNLDHQIAVLETELRRTSHPALEEFRQDALARADAARWQTAGGGFKESREDAFGRRSQVPLSSNAASVQRVIAALRDAIRETEQLQLTATPDAEIAARISAWRGRLNVKEMPEPEPVPGQPRPWRDTTRKATAFPEIESPTDPVGPILTPAEAREVAWRADEARR